MLKNISVKKIIKWLDIARGYGILLVILGHIGVAGGERWIYTFHMPLFFFLSGYTINVHPRFSKFLAKKVQTLLVPYFCMGMITILFQIFFNPSPDITYFNNFLNKFRELFTQMRAWDLWFLATLFWLELIFYGIVRLCKKLWIIGLVSLGFSIFGVYYYTVIRQGMPWNIDVCFLVMIFMYLGFLCRKLLVYRVTDLNPVNRFAYDIIFLLAIIINISAGYVSFVISKSHVDIYAGNIGFAPASFLAAVFGILIIIFISRRTHSKLLRYMGKNSMVFYMWHMDIMMPIFNRLLAAIGISYEKINTASYWLHQSLLLILVIISLILINELICRTRLRFLLGKFK